MISGPQAHNWFTVMRGRLTRLVAEEAFSVSFEFSAQPPWTFDTICTCVAATMKALVAIPALSDGAGIFSVIERCLETSVFVVGHSRVTSADIAVVGDRPTSRTLGYATPDGERIRDYAQAGDLDQTHTVAIEYLRSGQISDAANPGRGTGHSGRQATRSASQTAGHPPSTGMSLRLRGDAPLPVAGWAKPARVLAWQPRLSELKTIVPTAWMWRPRPYMSPGGGQ